MGIRNMVMPGARRVMMVVTMLTAARMVPRPDSTNPMIHRSAPVVGVFSLSLSGAYPVQPKSGAPSGVRKLPSTISPPNRNAQ